MKIPSSTQAHKPAAGQPAPIGAQDGRSTSRRDVVRLQGEDGTTVPIVAPPPEVLARIRSEAAALTAAGTATADERTRQLADGHEDARPATADDAPQGSDGESRVSSIAPPVDDRQPFKVVLTCKPAPEGRWHVTVGVGRDGCDPVFEPAEVAEWPDALDAVLGVHATAVARWAEHPRNTAISGTNRPGTRDTTSSAKAAKHTERGPLTKGKETRGPLSAGAGAAVAGSGTPPQPSAPLGVQRPAAAPTPVAAGVEQITLF